MIEQEEAKSETPYDPVGKCVDLRKYRVTYWPQNSRMGLPKATKPVMEAELVTKKTKYRE